MMRNGRCRAWLLMAALAIGGATSVRADDPQARDDRDDRRAEREDRTYQSGMRSLDKRDWDRAIEAFNQVIEGKGSRADGALYWKAYALNKLGRRAEATAAISSLMSSYPSSRWANDAKALEFEVKQAGNQPVRPEDQSDEEMKLIAIATLMESGSDRALPMLEKVLQSSNSLRVKERALFVLAQTGSPQARDTLARVAKGASNPDLQSKAIEYLGVFGGQQNRQLLNEIYEGTQDLGLRRKILQSFMVMGDKGRILAVAKSEKNPELRRKAAELLGAMGAREELWQLYQAEQAPEVRKSLMQGLFISGDASHIAEIAKSDKDVNMRRNAIHHLGTMDSRNTADTLLSIYQSNSDVGIKKAVMEALFIQGNAKQLIDLARKENDPALKKSAVERLSHMHSKEATDYMIEILNKD